MKKQLFFILMAIISMPVFAQKVSDIKNPNIQSSGTHFANPTTDKKWSNANGNSYTKAKYSEYDGITFVKLSTVKDLNLSLQFDIKVEKGQLEMQVVDSKNEILFEKSFTKNEIGNTEFSLKSEENYQIKFIGTKTKGSYFCQWIEK